MDDSTKQILDIITNIQEQMVTKDDLENVRIELKGDIESVRQELKSDIESARLELQRQISENTRAIAELAE